MSGSQRLIHRFREGPSAGRKKHVKSHLAKEGTESRREGTDECVDRSPILPLRGTAENPAGFTC